MPQQPATHAVVVREDLGMATIIVDDLRSGRGDKLVAFVAIDEMEEAAKILMQRALRRQQAQALTGDVDNDKEAESERRNDTPEWSAGKVAAGGIQGG